MAMAPIFRPAIRSGRYFFRCSSLPLRQMFSVQRIAWAPNVLAVAAQPRASSSMARTHDMIPSPLPPNSGGMEMPKRPSSAMAWKLSLGKTPS